MCAVYMCLLGMTESLYVYTHTVYNIENMEYSIVNLTKGDGDMAWISISSHDN